MSDTALRWYAARISPQKEARAHELLTASGFESMFAHETREVRRLRHRGSPEKTRRTVPLLPGYALVRHDGSPESWQVLARLEWPGTGQRVVHYWVGLDHQPWPIPEPSISALEAMSGRVRGLPGRPKIAVGGLARVTAGPLDGLAGKVQRVTDKRVMMLLGMFGAERVVEVRADVLEAA